MRARVTIYDDNGSPKGAYELMPSREFDMGLSMKYIFEFEYNMLKDDVCRYRVRGDKDEIIDNADQKDARDCKSVIADSGI